MASKEKQQKETSDLISKKAALEQSTPGLKQSYGEFLDSFAKFRQTEEQFRGRGGTAPTPRPRSRMQA